MSTDPFDLNYDFSDQAYADLQKDADTDNRVGDHVFLVSEVTRGNFPKNGDPYLKVKGTLLTANNAKTDWTFSPPPPPDVIAAQKSSWEPGKKKAINASIQMIKQLAEHYGTTPGKIKQGDEFKVKTAKTRVDKNTGDGGFIRIVAFLPKGHAVAGGAAAASSASPF